MTTNLGTNMVRLRVIHTEEEDDARILAFRKKRREELLAEAAANPKPRSSFMENFFRGRRTITIT
jgi:hypothetical protein